MQAVRWLRCRITTDSSGKPSAVRNASLIVPYSGAWPGGAVFGAPGRNAALLALREWERSR